MRTGIFRCRRGDNYDITPSVLEKIAQTFDPKNPPHILVGHPDTSTAPSFGIVDALKVVGDKLFFRPARYCAEFAALVRRGGFPGVSAGVTRDLTRLDHVALLSAQKPAIDGLEPIAEFSASADMSSYIDITETAAGGLAEFGIDENWLKYRLRDIADIFRNVKNFIIERSGAEEADRIISEYALDSLNEEPPSPETAAEFSASREFIDNIMNKETGAVGSPADTPPPADDDQTKYNELQSKYDAAQAAAAGFAATIQKRTEENAVLSERVAELEKQIRLAEFSSWIEERIAEGRVLPDEKQDRVNMMETILLNTGAEFSADPVKHPKSLDVYKRDIMARPQRTLTKPMSAPEFASVAHVRSDPWTIGKRARDYMDEMTAKGVNVSIEDACEHVRQKLKH